jgi:hypothetical protein
MDLKSLTAQKIPGNKSRLSEKGGSTVMSEPLNLKMVDSLDLILSKLP